MPPTLEYDGRRFADRTILSVLSQKSFNTLTDLLLVQTSLQQLRTDGLNKKDGPDGYGFCYKVIGFETPKTYGFEDQIETFPFNYQ